MLWPCKGWTSSSRLGSRCTWWTQSRLQHWQWQTMGWQVGCPSRRRWWTSRVQWSRGPAHKGPNQSVGLEWKWGRPSRPMRERWAFGRGSLGRRNRRSCKWKQPQRIGFGLSLPWFVLLSRAEPCGSNQFQKLNSKVLCQLSHQNLKIFNFIFYS